MQEQLAHGAHYEVKHHAGKGIDKDNRGASERNGLPCPHKEPRADAAANGNHFHLAAAEPPLEFSLRAGCLHEKALGMSYSTASTPY